jgi:hypothetical protein
MAAIERLHAALAAEDALARVILDAFDGAAIVTLAVALPAISLRRRLIEWFLACGAVEVGSADRQDFGTPSATLHA